MKHSAKTVSLYTCLSPCFREKFQRFLKTDSNPWTCTSYGISMVDMTFIRTRLLIGMVSYLSKESQNCIEITTTMRFFWLQIFFNYKTVINILSRSAVSSFSTFALANFYCKILDLKKVYPWQEVVSLLMLNFYTQIVKRHPVLLFPVKNSGQITGLFLQSLNNINYFRRQFYFQHQRKLCLWLCLQPRPQLHFWIRLQLCFWLRL